MPDVFDIDVARQNVLDYLSGQNDAYFAERGKTKDEVLADNELIDALAAEHLKCVMQFGNDRGWSVKNACDVEPGIGEPL